MFLLVFALIVFVFCCHRRQLVGHAQEAEWRLVEKTFIRYIILVFNLPWMLCCLLRHENACCDYLFHCTVHQALHELSTITSCPVHRLFNHLFIISWFCLNADQIWSKTKKTRWPAVCRIDRGATERHPVSLFLTTVEVHVVTVCEDYMCWYATIRT